MAGTLLGPMASYHFDRDADFNEANPGIGYRHDNGLLGGVYKNSYGKTSVYAGKNWQVPVGGLLNAGVTVGGVTGYPAGKVLPMLVPEINAKTGDVTWALMLQPPVGGKTKGAIGLQIRKDIK